MKKDAACVQAQFIWLDSSGCTRNVWAWLQPFVHGSESPRLKFGSIIQETEDSTKRGSICIANRVKARTQLQAWQDRIIEAGHGPPDFFCFAASNPSAAILSSSLMR